MDIGPSPFSIWIRQNLKGAYSGLIAQDIDYIVKTPNKSFVVIEEKIYKGARTSPAQAIIYKMLSDILKTDSSFEGCHKITVQDNGQLFVNNAEKMLLDNFINNPLQIYNNGYWFEYIIKNNWKYLWDGKGTPFVQKTQQEKTFMRQSKLEKLLKNANLSFIAIDWIIVNYCTGYFIILSENEDINTNILKMIDEKFTNYNKSNNIVKNPKSLAEYKYLGMYNLKYNNNLTEFEINDEKLNYSQVIKMLNLDTDEIENLRVLK